MARLRRDAVAAGALGTVMAAAVLAGCSSLLGIEALPTGELASDAGELESAVADTTNQPDGAPMDAATRAPDVPTGIVVTAVYDVTTLAGSGAAAFADGTGTAASFNAPFGVAVDASGNLFVADAENNRIRRVTPAGVVTTLAGSGAATFGNGTGGAASFDFPNGIAVNAAGDVVFVADQANNCIRRVTAAGEVTTLAGSQTHGYFDDTGTSALFWSPVGVALDPAGNLFVGDRNNNRIRRVTSAGVVTTVAGSGIAMFADGTGVAASFYAPTEVAIDAAGNVYVADRSNHRIRKATPAGVVTTLAGSTLGEADGTGADATFNMPSGVAVGGTGDVYVSDTYNHRIRRVTAAGVVTTVAGSGMATFADGMGAEAGFYFPEGIAVDAAGTIYVGDSSNNRIRKIIPGLGRLAVAWSVPNSAGSSPISGYTASASAVGHPTRTCATTDVTACVITDLTSGSVYTVTVTATNLAGTSAPSVSASATPN